MNVPYKKIYLLAEKANVKKKEEFGPILESGKFLGFGWIGVQIEKPSMAREDVIYIKDHLEMYQHVGPYKTICNAYKQIKGDHPTAEVKYNFYLDDPSKIKPEICRTEILFK